MKTKQILEQVLYFNNTEHQGIAVSSQFETIREFVERWFGKDVDVVAGGYENNKEYFYSYIEPLKGIADMILMTDNCTIYLYMIED